MNSPMQHKEPIILQIHRTVFDPGQVCFMSHHNAARLFDDKLRSAKSPIIKKMMSEPSLAYPAGQPGPLASSPTRGERWVACFEAAKGILVILAGFGLLSLMHHDLQHFAKAFVDHLHLNPGGRSSHVFLSLATISSQRLWLLAAMSCAYSALRLAEAYGLWTGKRWAKWFAAASGGLYMPLEAWELLQGISWIKAAAFLLNAGIVLYMIYALRRDQRALSG